MPRGQGKGCKAAKESQKKTPSFPFGIDLESLDNLGRSMFGETQWHLKTTMYKETINDWQKSHATTESEWTDRIHAIAMLSETEVGLYPDAELKRIRAVKALLSMERFRMEEKEYDMMGFAKDDPRRPENSNAETKELNDFMRKSSTYPRVMQQISALDAQLSATEAKLRAAVEKDSRSDRQKPSTGSDDKTNEAVKKEGQQKVASQEALKAADDKAERLEQKLRAAREEIGELQFQLERARANAAMELKAVEDAHRSELEKNTAQIQQLKESLTEAEKKVQRLRESDELATLKRQHQKEREARSREKDLTLEAHRKEIEKANAQLRELQQSVIQAEDYARDMERYRTEMQDARTEVVNLRGALAEAWDEKDQVKRDNDLLTADAEAHANEIERLRGELASASAKVEELSAQIAALNEAGVAVAVQNRSRSEEAFKTFQSQVYVTVFANHDGYTNIEQLQNDLHEVHALNGEEVAQSYGYDSLSDFLHSREMASRISTEIGPNGVVYKGIPNETNAHLREAHQISTESQAAQNTKLRRNLKTEERKVASLRQEIKVIHEQRRCQICMDRPSDTTFLCGPKNGPKDACGHVVCGDCAENWRRQGKGCHLCRGEPVFKCVKLFLAGTQ